MAANMKRWKKTKLTTLHSNNALVTCKCCGPGVLEVKCLWCAKDLAISEGMDTGIVPYLEFFSGKL